jgi:RNA polymerase sigma-70 factor (ECF subfamily)
MREFREAFESYLRPHWQRLHRMARRYVPEEDAARDLVQETLLRAWRAFSPHDSHSRAWLMVILRNVVIDWRRAARRRIRLVSCEELELTDLAAADLGEPFAPFGAMDEARFREFLDQQVAAALDAIEPQFREVIYLTAEGGLNYREIAEVLDCPIGTVMSRMARARRALRERLADYVRPRDPVTEARP